MGRQSSMGIGLGLWTGLCWSGGTALTLSCAGAAGGAAPASSGEAGAGCQVLGEHAALDGVVVEAGAQRLALRLTDARVRVVPASGRALAELRVEAPLVFATSYALRELDVRTTRAIALGDGRIRVGRGVRPSVIDVRGEALVVSLAADLGLEVAPPPELSCNTLTLAPRGAPRETPARKEQPGARLASLDPAGIALHATARDASAWHVRYAGPIELVSSDDGWFHVRAEWEDGSALDGWTPAPPLAAPPWPSGHVDGVAMPGGCHATDEPPTRTVLARAGAPVSATPGAAAWALFAAETRVEAQGSGPDGWLSIRAVPGIAVDTCDHWFWVRAADVSDAP